MAATAPTFEYDVFLSHSSKDKPIVRALAERLRDDGLRVWLDEWVIQPEDMISLAIENDLEKSRTLVLCMSEQAFGSDWVTLERHTVMFRDPTNQERRFIPLRLDDGPIKDILKQFAYIDWRKQEQQQYERLRKACSSLNVQTSARSQIEKTMDLETLNPSTLSSQQNQFIRAVAL